MFILLFQKEQGASTRTFICHSCGFPDSMTVKRCFSTLIYLSVKKELQQANLHSLKGSLYTGMVFRPQNMIQGRQFQKFSVIRKGVNQDPQYTYIKRGNLSLNSFLRVSLVKC